MFFSKSNLYVRLIAVHEIGVTFMATLEKMRIEPSTQDFLFALHTNSEPLLIL